MDSLYPLIALLIAGSALAMAIFSHLTFVRSASKIDFVFSLLCLLVAAFILLTSAGFVFPNPLSPDSSIRLKRVFNLSLIALLPGLIAMYCGYHNKRELFGITILIIGLAPFIPGVSTEKANETWLLLSIIIVSIVLSYGFYTSYRQFKNGQETKAFWVFVGVFSFGVFHLLGAASLRGNQSFAGERAAQWLPIYLTLLAIIVILGIQLRAKLTQYTKPETGAGVEKISWPTLFGNMHLIVVNTDTAGRVKYINPYGAGLLGYNDPIELINTNWSAHYLYGKDTPTHHTEKEHLQINGKPNAPKKKVMITKEGKEKIVSWSSVALYDDDGSVVGIMNIGSDITDHEEVILQLKELKAEFEKENLAQHKELSSPGMNKEVIGQSRPFMYAVQKSKQVAPTNASVLLLGETGVGKEAFADFIQEISLRSNKPFVKVNCGALPAELIEDELFGHEKGAFTGAIQSRIGRFEKANGGTIFLDEIGELPLVLQPKLLRVLQNGEFERVGGHQTIKVDVRVIAATNNDLEKEVKENRFRDDLFYRLNVFPITIPPLRKRSEDIMLLIQHFIELKSREHGKRFENISKADMNRLCDYEWPGNIRELKNVIERAVISSDNHTLKLDWFYKDIENSSRATSPTTSLEEMETAHILKVLKECRWKINGESGAAEKLVMHPNTLRSRMKKLKINVPWKQGQLTS